MCIEIPVSPFFDHIILQLIQFHIIITPLPPFCYTVCLFFIPAGDTGEGEEPTEGELIRESDNTFTIWASGRQNCLGMAIQLDVRESLHVASGSVVSIYSILMG